MHKWKVTLSLLLASLTLCWIHTVASEDRATPGVSILAPTSGATVRPGEEVTVNVELDPSISATEMLISAAFGFGKSGIPKVIQGPPFTSTVTIPTQATGPGEIIAYFPGDHGATVSVVAIPDDPVTRIKVANPKFFLEPPAADGSFNESTGLRRIQVDAYYEDGVRRSVTESILGTTYSTLDPSIATVTSEGLIEPVSEGLTYIKVMHRGFTGFAEATVVTDFALESLPPQDATDNFRIESSGFRRDFESGLFRQVLRLTNEAQHPYSKLHVMLSGLADGISLDNADGESENITPLGEPYVFVSRPPGDDFLESGESVDIELEFINPQGAPINYTPRVIAVSDP